MHLIVNECIDCGRGKHKPNQNPHGGVLLYQTEDGKMQIEVTLENETVWLTIDQMAELFQRKKSTIFRHIKGVLEIGELDADSTVAFFSTVQKEGARQIGVIL